MLQNENAATPVENTSSAANCPYCSESIHANAIKCKHCGEVLKKAEYNEKKFQWKEDYDRTGIPEHHLEQFRTFDIKRGSFAPTWNWYASLFGMFWYIYKGMWAKAAIIAVAAGVFGGVPAILFWVYCGVAGNYDYYLLKTQGKQFW